MIALTASIITHSGKERAKQWLSGLKRNLARKPQGNDRAQVKAIHEGLCDAAIINHYYMAMMLSDPAQKNGPNQFTSYFLIKTEKVHT